MKHIYSVQTFNTQTKQWEDLIGLPKYYDQQRAVKNCQRWIDAFGLGYRVFKARAN